jgi:hypothetical protein
MTNNIFKQFRQGIPAGQQGQSQQMPDINQLYGKFQQDPMQALGSCFKIPGEVGNDPNAILDYLTRSGQVTPQQLANAQKMQAKMFGRGM